MARVKAPRVFLSPPFPLDINIDEVGFRLKKGLRTAALHIITETRGRPQIRSVNPKTRIKYRPLESIRLRYVYIHTEIYCTSMKTSSTWIFPTRVMA